MRRGILDLVLEKCSGDGGDLNGGEIPGINNRKSLGNYESQDRHIQWLKGIGRK
jgi:hypothetical protein